MTPKEKAQELFDKYYILFNNFPNYQYVIENLNTIQDEKLYTTKQCALIAVDELIKYHDEFMDVVRYELPSNIVASIPYKYWDEIKQEIEKL
jgi:hypothetical protein